MKLSVVIVNYNVSNELHQCLDSVLQSLQDIESEVFVVDNNSTDDSCVMVREQFPKVHLIENKDNVGFAKANNQAIREAKGEYILLLNPDTIVKLDSFSKMLEFADTQQNLGGLGVRMIDGQGKFLPESKRGIPTPFTAFCKISGLYKLFPKSNVFNHYYLGNLSDNEINEVEILAGACMLIRKTVLDEIGLLDETYFLYGEDIDISYRMLLHGYSNYYLPSVEITHFKGVSTNKNQQESKKAFYGAMEIFVDTYYNQLQDNVNGGSSCIKRMCSKISVWMLKCAIRFCYCFTI